MQETEAVLKRYGAVAAERDEWGFCCALGLEASCEKNPSNGLKSVQCALQLLSSLSQASTDMLTCSPEIRAQNGLLEEVWASMLQAWPCDACLASFEQGPHHCHSHQILCYAYIADDAAWRGKHAGQDWPSL